MKFDTYERAVEIRSEIDYLTDVDGLLSNAAQKQHNLAAVRLNPYECQTETINQTYLTEGLLVKFRSVIKEGIDKLNKEFEAL